MFDANIIGDPGVHVGPSDPEKLVRCVAALARFPQGDDPRILI